MRKKILLIFCICVMIFSIAIVTLQAFDYVKAMNCANYCDGKYPEDDGKFEACWDGCYNGPD